MKISKELKSGIIVIVSLALVFWGFSFLKKKNYFITSEVYYSEFENIQGLTPASIVTINGFNVGNVSNIEFNPKKKGNIIVTFSMNKDFSFSKKSTTKITSSLMGGAELSIIPNYDGDTAVSGDFLTGITDYGMLNSLTTKLAPLDDKLNATLQDADKLLINLNTILDTKTQQNLKATVAKLNRTLQHFEGASVSLERMLVDGQPKLKTILTNADNAVANFNTLSNDLKKSDITGKLTETVTKLNTSLAKFDVLMEGMNSGKGSMGKLLKDEKLYNNLTKASKELEELLREVKLHPKRFVHLSVFGKKDKGYKENKELKDTKKED